MELEDYVEEEQQVMPLSESHIEVVKQNSDVRVCQDSEIRSVNFSIILTDADGNPLENADDDHAATESVMGSDVSRSVLSTMEFYYPRGVQSLTRQNGNASLMPENSNSLEEKNMTNANDNSPQTHPEVEYINIDSADDHFQESMGLFDWDIDLGRMLPVFPLPASLDSSHIQIEKDNSNLLHGDGSAPRVADTSSIVEAGYYFKNRGSNNGVATSNNCGTKENSTKCAIPTTSSSLHGNDSSSKSCSSNKGHNKKSKTSWRDSLVGMIFTGGKGKKSKDNRKTSSFSNDNGDVAITNIYPATLLQRGRHREVVPSAPASTSGSSSVVPRMQDLSIADRKQCVMSAEEKLITVVRKLKKMRKWLKRKNSNSSGRRSNSSSDVTMDVKNVTDQGVNIRTIVKNLAEQSSEKKMVQLVNLLKLKRERDKAVNTSNNTTNRNMTTVQCCTDKQLRDPVGATLLFLKHLLAESMPCTLQNCLSSITTPTCVLTSASISYILSAAARKRKKNGLGPQSHPDLPTQAPAKGSGNQMRIVDEMDTLEHQGIGQIAACARSLRTALIDLIPSNPSELVHFASNAKFSVSIPTDRLIYSAARNELSSSFILQSEGRAPHYEEINVLGLVKVLFVKDLGGRFFVSSCKLNFDPNAILKHSHNVE